MVKLRYTFTIDPEVIKEANQERKKMPIVPSLSAFVEMSIKETVRRRKTDASVEKG